MSERTLGIIGGSGIYDLAGLEDRQEVAMDVAVVGRDVVFAVTEGAARTRRAGASSLCLC